MTDAPFNRSNDSIQRLGVVGAGAWGTALAVTARRAGRDVVLWAREPEVVESVNRDRRNPVYLPGIALDGVVASGELAALAGCDALLLVTPAQHVRATCRAIKSLLAPDLPLLLCAKGIDLASGRLLSAVIAEELPGWPLAVLSGPTFAAEVGRGLPTAVTLASRDPGLARRLADGLGGPVFRPYVTDDVVGVEVGGAVKNVLAIACGVVEGRGLGDNARAALMTRGLAEMVRLALGLGGRAATLMGLSGLGDLILTASSLQSRNYSLGVALGQGRALASILAERCGVTEGVDTAAAVVALSDHRSIEMPICAAVAALLAGQTGIEESIARLLARPFGPELGFDPNQAEV